MLTGKACKDVEVQKQVLGALVASHDQERTTGTDIRDSKNALDNIKTAIADKLVPLAMEMRHGIMAIAGVGKGKSSEQIMQDVVEADSESRKKAISGRFAPEKGELEERQNYLEAKKRSLDPAALAVTYRDKPEVLADKLKERAMVVAELTMVDKRLKELELEKADLLKKENERKAKELADVHDGIEARWQIEGGSGGGPGPGGGGGSYGGGGPLDPKKRDEAMKYFISKGWSKEQAAGIVANLGAESKLNEGIAGDGGAAYGIAQWHSDRQQAFAAKYGRNIRGSSFQDQLGFVQHELTAGNEQAAGNLLKQSSTARQAGDIVSRYYERPRNTGAEASARGADAERIAKLGTPLPDGMNPGRGDDPRKFTVQTEPIIVRHENDKGQQVRPDQTIKTRVAPASPFGR